MTNLPGQLALILAAVMGMLSVWRPGKLSQMMGEVSPSGVQARPLALGTAAFFFGALLPGDPRPSFSRIAIVVCAALLGWIAYRARPDSWPIVGSRSRLARIGIFVSVALLGAVAGAVLFVIFADANLGGRSMPRLSEAIGIGAGLGPGAALSIWERRANSKLLSQHAASAE